ncbi:MAG: phenylalanine--tRNA ligase subunit beta [Propionibacteriaceae bacterium]
MKVPVSWLREYAHIDETYSVDQIAEALVGVGLELDAIERGAVGISGPVVVGRVLDFVDEPQKNGKVIRWCTVDVGAELNPEGAAGRGIICGASNFAMGDLVVAALPGAELPGGFAITSRKTYGHISDGMLCAVDELNLGTDHSGIIILPSSIDGRAVAPGDDALTVLGARENVLDLGVTPDMGYCLSIRGVAREAVQALGGTFVDPISLSEVPLANSGYPVVISVPECQRFVALSIDNIDANAVSPAWMVRRLQQAGMRSISLAVDVTNYVMLETGQPLHAYDADKLSGTVVVRKASQGEVLVTLDGIERILDTEDLVIADDAGVIGLAGIMGGARTEVGSDTSRIILEAANFDAVTVARASRRYQLATEASRRFERSVDPAAPYGTARRAAQLLSQYGGGTVLEDRTVIGNVPEVQTLTFPISLPSRILGREISRETVIDTLTRAGSRVTAMGDSLTVQAPSWRPDLREPIDFVEEIGRKTGLDLIEPRLPRPIAGRGLTLEQRRRRELASAMANAGLVEVVTLPFISDDQLDRMGIVAEDLRRRLVRIANPLSAEFPAVRTTLLAGLIDAALRNASRSQDDVALFEIGRVFFHTDKSVVLPAPAPGVEERPSDEVIESFERSLPDQPRYLGGLVAGEWRAKDWRGSAQLSGWEQAFAMADIAAAVYGVTLERRSTVMAPWHPGRCAELRYNDVVIGHAGELNPHICKVSGLKPRTAVFELNLDLMLSVAPGAGRIGAISSYPVVKEDVALIVDESVTVAEVTQALREGAGDLLESLALFDLYTGEQVDAGKKSLAFALRFRAKDRTLTQAEATSARESAIALAVARVGAVQRA